MYKIFTVVNLYWKFSHSLFNNRGLPSRRKLIVLALFGHTGHDEVIGHSDAIIDSSCYDRVDIDLALYTLFDDACIDEQTQQDTHHGPRDVEGRVVRVRVQLLHLQHNVGHALQSVRHQSTYRNRATSAIFPITVVPGSLLNL